MIKKSEHESKYVSREQGVIITGEVYELWLILIMPASNIFDNLLNGSLLFPGVPIGHKVHRIKSWQQIDIVIMRSFRRYPQFFLKEF